MGYDIICIIRYLFLFWPMSHNVDYTHIVTNIYYYELCTCATHRLSHEKVIMLNKPAGFNINLLKYTTYFISHR